MLGWEYPPRFAGGLGKACRGLSVAMARQGAKVYFVLPTFPDRIVEPRLEVVGAREILLESGWTEQMVQSLGRGPSEAPLAMNFEVIRTEAMMFPYGQHPQGTAPDTIRQMMHPELRAYAVSYTHLTLPTN